MPRRHQKQPNSEVRQPGNRERINEAIALAQEGAGREDGAAIPVKFLQLIARAVPADLQLIACTSTSASPLVQKTGTENSGQEWSKRAKALTSQGWGDAGCSPSLSAMATRLTLTAQPEFRMPHTGSRFAALFFPKILGDGGGLLIALCRSRIISSVSKTAFSICPGKR